MISGKTLKKGALAKIRSGKIDSILDFQFNPTSLQRSGTPKWIMGSGPGSLLPVATFGQMGEQVIPLELLYDCRETYEPKLEGLGGVLALCESFWLPAVDLWNSKTNAYSVPPDRCKLILGKRSWNCDCVGGTINEELFNNDLEPVRARVSLKLQLTNPGPNTVQKYMNDLNRLREEYSIINISPYQV